MLNYEERGPQERRLLHWQTTSPHYSSVVIVPFVLLHMYVYKRAYIHIYVCGHENIHMYVCGHEYVHMYVCGCANVHVCTWVCKCACICMWVCKCVYLYMLGMQMYMCRGLRLMSGVFLHCSPPSLSRPGLWLYPELSILSSLASLLVPWRPYLCLPCAGITGTPWVLGLWTWVSMTMQQAFYSLAQPATTILFKYTAITSVCNSISFYLS